jgi:Flp pilus assembly protein TadB
MPQGARSGRRETPWSRRSTIKCLGEFEWEANHMSTPESSKKRMGITLGGALVIAGIVIALVLNILVGIIVVLIGLIAFGGFVRGKWY